MKKIKIIAIIREQDGRYMYVINRDIKYIYTKIDRETIIGEDEGVLQFYKRDASIYPFGKTAFGGREFTLKLSDGTEEKCNGQWWDDFSNAALELYNIDDIVYFPSATIDDLKKFDLFYCRRCDRRWLEKLEAEYKGKIYTRDEYRNIIKRLI